MFKRYPKELREYIAREIESHYLRVAVDEFLDYLRGEHPQTEEWAQFKSVHPEWTKEDSLYIYGELLRVFSKKTTRTARKQGRANRQIVLARAKDHCEVCGSYWPYTLEIHHIVAVEHGGHGYPNNLIALCNNCHAVVHTLARVLEAFNQPDAPLEPAENLAEWIAENYEDKYPIFDAIAREWAQFEGSKLVLESRRPPNP